MDTLKFTDIGVGLDGVADIMFDRFYGQEKDTRPPEQKFYLAADNKVVLPAENIYAFLFAENPAGAAKTEGKTAKNFIRTGMANVIITPADYIPFLREGKPVQFKNKFDGKIFDTTQFAPRVKNGNLSIKQNIRVRPLLKLPWSIEFNIRVILNPMIDSDRLQNWFSAGGLTIGLGTYRPRYGRFMVSKWNVKEPE